MESTAAQLKERGNVLFKANQYESAIEIYLQASQHQNADSDLKAICYGNISICYTKFEDHAKAIEYANLSLELKPDYQKIRERKIKSLLQIGRVDEAKGELDKGEAGEEIKQEVDRAEKEQVERDKEEMLSKMKELGNSVLGKFGMSLDNFKVQKQQSGEYSINFSR